VIFAPCISTVIGEESRRAVRCGQSKTARSGCRSCAPSPCMGATGARDSSQRGPLPRTPRRGTPLSPPAAARAPLPLFLWARLQLIVEEKLIVDEK
jgi:hypothetical protein